MRPLVTRISVGDLLLARFTAADTRALWEIRNHDTVLPFLSDPRPIEYAAHEAWVRANLVDATRLDLFMARRRSETLGFSLLRPVDETTREIGLMFREPERYPLAIFNAAFGTVHYACAVLGVTLTSWVIPGHEKAFSLNQAFGAVEIPSSKPGMKQFHMTPETCLANETYRKVRARLGDRLVVSE